MNATESESLLARAIRVAHRAEVRSRVVLSHTSVAEWQRLWESEHPEDYWLSDRRHIVEEVLDFLESDSGSLGEIRLSVWDGRLNAHIDACESRGGSWFLQDGILPPECDRICQYLGEDDHKHCETSAAEGLIAATVATILHLQGVILPKSMWKRTRRRWCLVQRLDRIRRAIPTRDPWDALATEVHLFIDKMTAKAKICAEFPKNGPSGKWISHLLQNGWTWSKILNRAEVGGYTGGKAALRGRLDYAKHAPRRKKARYRRAREQ